VILNRVPLNSVALNSSGGIIGVNPNPANVYSSINDGSWSLVLTSVSITPATPSVTSSVAGSVIMKLEEGPVTPATLVIAQQSPTALHYGLEMSTTPTVAVLAWQVPPSIFLGLDFPATGIATPTVVGTTGTLRINFEQTVQQPATPAVVLQSPSMLHIGIEMEAEPATPEVVEQMPVGFSAATGYITVSATVGATSSIDNGIITLSSVQINATPLNVLTTVSSMLDTLEVVLGTVTVPNLEAIGYTSASVSTVVLGTVATTPKLPTVHSEVAFEGAVVIAAPSPLIITPVSIPTIGSSINDGSFEVVLGSITVDLHANLGTTATSSVTYSEVAIVGSAVVTPWAAQTYSEVLIGSKYVPVSVTPSVSVTSSVAGQAIIAPLVISGLSVESTSTVAVENAFYGTVVITGQNVSADSWIFPPQVHTTSLQADPAPAEVTSSVTVNSVVLSTIRLVNEQLETLSSVVSPQVVLSSVVIEPVPAEATTSIEVEAVTQPDLLISNLSVEVTSEIAGQPTLSSVSITPVSPSVISSAQGQFNYGTTLKTGEGGVVVTTDNRGQLNVDPLSRPGLNSITVQN
jgi:hypothetical protein